ncbi:MAG TPA: DinB family protein [Actinomycetota bacterium]|nr:DinB family protein [Actinomycetota bacterium]
MDPDQASKTPSRAPSAEEALLVIAQTPATLRGLLDGLSDETLGGGSASGVWGARQVLEHLIDAEGIAFRDRIARILDEDRPFILSIDPPSRILEGGYAERSLEELLSAFEELREASVAWLRSIDFSAFNREGEHEVAGTIRVGELLHYWAVHDLTHLSQMMTALRSSLLPHVGNMHRFLEE